MVAVMFRYKTSAMLLMLIVIDLSVGVGHLAAAPVVIKEWRAK